MGMAGGCQREALPLEQPAMAERIVGDWLVNEVRDAQLESTYSFRGDGGLVYVETIENGAIGPAAHTAGRVTRGATGPTCFFGERWSSVDASTIELASNCTDGTAREVMLRFASDAIANATGESVDVVSVAGQAGWSHQGFPWSFTKLGVSSH